MSFWEAMIGAYVGTVLGSITVGLIGFFLIKFLIKRLSQDPEVITFLRALKRKVVDDED